MSLLINSKLETFTLLQESILEIYNEHMQFLTSREATNISLTQLLGVLDMENSVHVSTKSTNGYRNARIDNSDGCFQNRLGLILNSWELDCFLSRKNRSIH